MQTHISQTKHILHQNNKQLSPAYIYYSSGNTRYSFATGLRKEPKAGRKDSGGGKSVWGVVGYNISSRHICTLLDQNPAQFWAHGWLQKKQDGV